MRGTLVSARPFAVLLRIIPADAGNTLNNGAFSVSWGDHPRGCGEHLSSQYSRVVMRGSSSRMRGTLMKCVALAIGCRIILADAGNTG